MNQLRIRQNYSARTRLRLTVAHGEANRQMTTPNTSHILRKYVTFRPLEFDCRLN